MTYSEKLKDPRWQKKRLEKLDGSCWTCLACGDTEKTLHVHHVEYTTKDPWDEKDTNLIVLCVDCHDTWHHLDLLKYSPKDITKVAKLMEFYHYTSARKNIKNKGVNHG